MNIQDSSQSQTTQASGVTRAHLLISLIWEQQQLISRLKKKGTVDLDNDEVKSLLSYIPKWAASTIDVAEGAGTLSKDIKIESKTYSWYYFCNNRCLTNITDPWYLTAGADESAKESESYIDSKDWDIYPFPSTDYCGNTIKVVMDPNLYSQLCS